MDYIKLFKQRISPSKETSSHASEAMISKQKAISSDDPFNDKSSKAFRSIGRLEDDNKPERHELKPSPFIRNSNISKSMVSHRQEELDSSSYDPNNHRLANETVRYSKDSDTDEKSNEKQEEEEAVVADILEPSGDEEDEEEDEDEVTLEVLEEMSKLEEWFPILSSNYKLIDKIGEGTFSTVYKAEALNGVVKLGSDIWRSPPLKKKRKTVKRKNPVVALKQIYVTSSPTRIYNELNLLYILTGNSHVAPLLDVLRYQDQVLAILPYYQHADFRDFYRDLPVKGIKMYLWELFQALSFVHEKGVIHRDLKPTNFLYDPFKGKGVLVDFGLAEQMQGKSKNPKGCPCQSKDTIPRPKRLNLKAAYPKQDQRPPRRANRAGTRGFRAPEVLFKCTNQSTKLDVWSAGIIGLSLISRKFPLFNSPDDIDALLELTLIFGIEKIQKCAELHGCGFELNVSGLTNYNGNLVKLLNDFLRYEWKNEGFPEDSVVMDTIKLFNNAGDKFVKPDTSDNDASGKKIDDYNDHKNLIELLNVCFHMDPEKRYSAKRILGLPFFEELKHDDEVLL